MKKTTYLLLLCMTCCQTINFAQSKIDIKGYLYKFYGDSLMKRQEFREAIHYYELASKKNIMAKGDMLYYLAYSYVSVRDTVMAEQTLANALEHGVKYDTKEELNRDWLLNRILKDTTAYPNLPRLIKKNLDYLNKKQVAFPEIKDSLELLIKLDQKYRSQGRWNDSIKELQRNIDLNNQNYVISLINRFDGIPDFTEIGEDGIHNLLLIVIHSNNKRLQKRVIKFIEKKPFNSYAIDLWDYALLRDKLSILKNKVQLFGTQVEMDEITGQLKLKPIDKNIQPYINELRAALWFPTVNEYLEDMIKVNKRN